MQSDRRVTDERDLSDSEDEDGDNRRDRTNFKRKASSDAVNGTSITQISKVTESTVIAPLTNEQTNENGSTNETAAAESETIITTTTTTTTEEIIKTTPVEGEGEVSVPVETATDGMDTSE